jgi:hypothetical protein
MKNNAKSYPIPALREELRLQSSALAQRLSRSVGRLTSCENAPCLEYGEEVRFEEDLIRRILYLQHCREALERCIPGSRVTVRFRRPDGSQGRTTFRKEGPNRVRVTGLTEP